MLVLCCIFLRVLICYLVNRQLDKGTGLKPLHPVFVIGESRWLGSMRRLNEGKEALFEKVLKRGAGLPFKNVTAGGSNWALRTGK